MGVQLVKVLRARAACILFTLSIVLVCTGTLSLEAAISTHKVPAQIVNVSGSVNNMYSIVQTTIYKDVSRGTGNETQQSEAGKSIIQRSQVDTIGPNRQSTKLLDIKLELPIPPVSIETYGATKVLDKVGQFVGAVGGPKGMAVGVGLSGMAAIADYATGVAEQELTKLYENQQFRINLLEIIPSRYYTIDMQTNIITPSEQHFREGGEIDDYRKRLGGYLDALKIYQDVQSRYAEWYKKLVAFDPSGKQVPGQWEQLRAYDRDFVQKALVDKNRTETEFSKLYPPYRIAIMASPATPGNTCKQFGAGPWELHIIYYMGAEQTNQIAARYCVRNVKSPQTFMVELMQNEIQVIDAKTKQQRFMPGGIRIVAQNNATFSQSTGFQAGNFGADKTEVFNWFTSMVRNPAGDSIQQFMVPFDLHVLRQDVADKLKGVKDAKLEEVLKSMDVVIARGAEAKAALDKQKEEEKQKQALESGSAESSSSHVSSKSSDTGLLGSMFGGDSSSSSGSAQESVEQVAQSQPELSIPIAPPVPRSSAGSTALGKAKKSDMLVEQLQNVKFATASELQAALKSLGSTYSTAGKVVAFIRETATVESNAKNKKMLDDAAVRVGTLMSALSKITVNNVTKEQKDAIGRALSAVQKDRLIIGAHTFDLPKSMEAKNVSLSLIEFLESLVQAVLSPTVARTVSGSAGGAPVAATQRAPATAVAPPAAPGVATTSPAQTPAAVSPAPSTTAQVPAAVEPPKQSAWEWTKSAASSAADKVKAAALALFQSDIAKIITGIGGQKAIDILEERMKSTDPKSVEGQYLQQELDRRRKELQATTGVAPRAGAGSQQGEQPVE